MKGHLDVSKNRGYPQIIHFHRTFHYKLSILGLFLETPICPSKRSLVTFVNEEMFANQRVRIFNLKSRIFITQSLNFCSSLTSQLKKRSSNRTCRWGSKMCRPSTFTRPLKQSTMAKWRHIHPNSGSREHHLFQKTR